jgi:hypothetical protein
VALGQMTVSIVLASVLIFIGSLQTNVVLFMLFIGTGVFFSLATTAGVTVQTRLFC